MSLRTTALILGAGLLAPSIATAQYGQSGSGPQQPQIQPGAPAPPAPPAPAAGPGFNPYQAYGQQQGQGNSQQGQGSYQQGQGNNSQGQGGQNNNQQQSNSGSSSNPYQPPVSYVPNEKSYHLAQREAMVLGLSKLNPFVFYPAPEDVVSVRGTLDDRQLQALVQVLNGSPQATWIAQQLTGRLQQMHLLRAGDQVVGYTNGKVYAMTRAK